jgi:CHAT domain-containing protein
LAVLDELADVLLPPGLPDELHARGYRQLVIVADAYLQQVPFAALRPVRAGARAYLGLPDEKGGFQLVFAPSTSIFSYWARRVIRRNGGDSRYASLFVDPLGDLSTFNPGVRRVFSVIESRLRDRKIEVQRFDGNAATPAVWLDKARGSDLVIYFGHSNAGQKDTGRAALSLSDGSGASAPVTAEDVYRAATKPLFSKESLFVFASCSSGFVSAGAWDSDRELRGLSAAHLYAGCCTVIAASRPLLDSPTLVILDALVKGVLSGLDAASTLTAAQSELAASQAGWAHPHFWGYLVLMGAPDWRFSA